MVPVPLAPARAGTGGLAAGSGGLAGAVFPPQAGAGAFEGVVAGEGVDVGLVDEVGAVVVDDAEQPVRGAPDPGVGADLGDPVAEVGLGPVAGAGEVGGVVVAAGSTLTPVKIAGRKMPTWPGVCDATMIV